MNRRLLLALIAPVFLLLSACVDTGNQRADAVPSAKPALYPMKEYACNDLAQLRKNGAIETRYGGWPVGQRFAGIVNDSRPGGSAVEQTHFAVTLLDVMGRDTPYLLVEQRRNVCYTIAGGSVADGVLHTRSREMEITLTLKDGKVHVLSQPFTRWFTREGTLAPTGAAVAAN